MPRMNDPGDSTLQSAAAESAVDPEPPERLAVSIVAEAGDWSTFPSAEARIAEAAAALARHPRCVGARGAEATVVLADDALVRTLNATYRGQDKATNVLSFPFGAQSAGQLGLGDVVLAVETIVLEAGEQSVPPIHHLQHLVVHGLLHLLGFEHDTDASAGDMEAVEIEILAELGVADPYASAESK
jgi:probable rRNA maturation factor